MTVAACAELLQKGDPERFRAIMAAPVGMRTALFPIFAFNLEVARAPWVSNEPMVGEIRLQWWLDALDEIAAGVAPRRHEVVTPLAEVLAGTALQDLTAVANARRRDCHGDGFADTGALWDYLGDTGGALFRAAGQATGQGRAAEALYRFGRAAALANYLRAVPELVARGRTPLPSAKPAAVAGLAREGLNELWAARADLPRSAYPLSRIGWLADRTLRSAAADPSALSGGLLHISEFTRRGTLLWRVLLSRP